MHIPRNKTLEELERDKWHNTSLDSYLSSTIHQLSLKPIGEFSIEDLRIVIGQSIGLSHLVPIAIEQLERNPLAEGDYYPGDLISSVLQIPKSFWASNMTLHARLLPIVELAIARIDDSDLHELASDFIAAA